MLHSTETLDSIKKLLTGLRTNKEGEEFKRERWVTIEEAHLLYNLVYLEGVQNYYESGTANGYSASWATLAILQNATVPNSHTWDPHNRDKIWEKFSVFKNFKKLINFHNEEFVSSKKMNKIPSRSLFFIDGSHSQAGFSQDFDHVKRMAVKGDIIMVHDALRGYPYILTIFEDFCTGKKYKVVPTERGIGIVWL